MQPPKKETLAQVFSSEFCEISKNTFFIEHLKATASEPRTKVTHFRNSSFKRKIKRLQIPPKLVYEKFYVHEKILRTQNCCRKFIKS